jgi:tellurium resistance protein TerD
MSVNLTKGTSVNLTSADSSLAVVTVGLGWDPAEYIPEAIPESQHKGFFSDLLRNTERAISKEVAKVQDIDVDASAFMLDANYRFRKLVYYGDKIDIANGIELDKDDRSGKSAKSGEDNEKIFIELSRVQPDICHIDLWANVYDTVHNHQHFGMIKNAFIRLVNKKTNVEVCRFNLSNGEYKLKTAVRMGSLDRVGNGWEFHAAGEATTDTGLSVIRDRYIREGGVPRESSTPSVPISASQQSIPVDQPIPRGNTMINLSKGGVVNLSKDHPALKNVHCGLEWNLSEIPGVKYDLDFSMIGVGANNKAQNEGDFIFYGQKKHASGAIYVLEDNLDGNDANKTGDYDEEGFITLDKIPANITGVVLFVSINEWETRKQNFGQVVGAFVEVLNQDTKEKLIHYDLSSQMTTGSGVVVGRFDRDGAGWKFTAVGKQVEGGLPELLSMFGLGSTGGV